MRRLSLHIGAHKTGTTSLQRTLQLNQKILNARGIAYACVAPAPQVHRYLGFLNPSRIFPSGFCVRDPQAFAEFLSQHASDHVCASSENFSFIFQQKVLDDLAVALRRKFDQIDILVYLRRQDRHAVSHHQEGAKPDRKPETELWGHGLDALPEPAEIQRLYLDYDARLMLWENAFGRQSLRVRVFDRALLLDGDIVVDAMQLMGLDSFGLARVADCNLSLGHLQAVIGHLANDAFADKAVITNLLEAFSWDDNKMLPTEPTARAFLAPYIEGNRRLNARLNISPEPDLFSNDFSDFPAERSGTLGHEDWANVLRVVIGALGTGATALRALTANDLRDAALALEKNQPQVALRFVTAAHENRPNGNVINRLKGDLERRLSAASGSTTLPQSQKV